MIAKEEGSAASVSSILSITDQVVAGSAGRDKHTITIMRAVPTVSCVGVCHDTIPEAQHQ